MDGDFVHEGVTFLMRLSDSIFGKLGGVNSVDYSTMDGDEWKTDFFGTREKAKLLRESSLLPCRKTLQKSSSLALKRGLSVRGKSTYSFSHGSILEFFYPYLVYDPRKEPPFYALSVCLDSTDDLSPLSSHPLGRQDLVSWLLIIHFLAERVQQDPDFEHKLHAVVQLSRTNACVGKAATNAITILVRAGVNFNGIDLQRIRAPGADLSGGHFDSCQLRGADLEGANLTATWL